MLSPPPLLLEPYKRRHDFIQYMYSLRHDEQRGGAGPGEESGFSALECGYTDAGMVVDYQLWVWA